MKSKLMTWLKRMLLAFQMMSRIPINVALPCGGADMLGSMIFFPLVGGVIGGLMALALWVGVRWFDSYAVAAFLAVLCDVLATGGIHLDGLGDTCDGIFSSRDRARMLEIMHDSRTGTFGALGLILTLMGEFAFIHGMLSHMGLGAVPFVIATPTLSRLCVVLLERQGRSARKGMGSAYVDGMTWVHALGAALVAVVIVAICRPYALIGVPLAAVLAFVFNRYFNGKLGGLTGDTLGAVNVISSLIFYALWALLPN